VAQRQWTKDAVPCYSVSKILTLSFLLRERCEYGFLAAENFCGSFAVAVPSGTVFFVYGGTQHGNSGSGYEHHCREQ
jgi:hypothetical protein